MYYVDNLYFFRGSGWFVFEPLSKVMFLILRWITGDTEHTVAYAHYYITIVYFAGSLLIFPPSEGNWRGLLMAFALYGPQLAFVTIRATPAYFVESLAVMYAIRGRKSAFLWAALAIMFHISSVIALIPIAAFFLKARIRGLYILHSPKFLVISLVIFGLVFLAFGPFILDAARFIFDKIPFLGKYLVFTVGIGGDGSSGSAISGIAIGHFILLACITAFTLGYLVIDDKITRSSAIFVIISYVIYSFIFLAFSPVAAFRQTPFWVLSAFSVFPWHRVGWRGAGQFLFLGLAAGMFLFQFSRVI